MPMGFVLGMGGDSGGRQRGHVSPIIGVEDVNGIAPQSLWYL